MEGFLVIALFWWVMWLIGRAAARRDDIHQARMRNVDAIHRAGKQAAVREAQAIANARRAGRWQGSAEEERRLVEGAAARAMAEERRRQDAARYPEGVEGMALDEAVRRFPEANAALAREPMGGRENLARQVRAVEAAVAAERGERGS